MGAVKFIVKGSLSSVKIELLTSLNNGMMYHGMLLIFCIRWKG